jgi:B12-binding domain/radical SAM domain protein
VVAISFCTPQIYQIANLVKSLRGKFGNEVILVAGGPHPTGDPENTLKLGFDLVVVGEGEETFSELLIKLKQDEDYKNIKGIAYFSDGKYKFTGFRKPINLDDYPAFAVKHKKFNSIEITRGCTFGCKFCQTTFLYHGPIRHRRIENVCKYVEIMLKEGLTDIRFITPNSFGYSSPNGKEVNLEAVENLLKSVRGVIKNKGRIFFGSFPSEVRPEHVTSETIELVKKYCNNDNLVIGTQSGSLRILKECRRGHSVEDVYNAVELTTKAGLKANVDFMFGLPHETEEDMNMTLEVMKDLIKMGARIHGHTFMPLAGTPYYNESPGKLDKETIGKLNKLASRGKLYGDWRKQEKIAEKIYEFVKE